MILRSISTKIVLFTRRLLAYLQVEFNNVEFLRSHFKIQVRLVGSINYSQLEPVRRNMEIIIIDNHDVVYLSTVLPFETLRAAHGELPGPLSGVLQGFHFVHLKSKKNQN